MTGENEKFISYNLPPATCKNVRDNKPKTKGGTLGRKKYSEKYLARAKRAWSVQSGALAKIQF